MDLVGFGTSAARSIRSNRPHDELFRIVEDLTDPLRADDRATWEVRPLRHDDYYERYPEYLDGDVPRYWWVTVEGRSMVADLTSSSASRIYFMAEMAQDELAEERRRLALGVPSTART